MKYIFSTGAILISILLGGCEKKTAPTANSASPPAQAEITNPSPAPQPLPSDAELLQKIAGLWKFNNTNKILGTIYENSYILATNRNFVKQTVLTSKTSKKNFTGTGIWGVNGGNLVITITKANPIPDDAMGNALRAGLAAGAFVNRYRIIDVTDSELAVEVDATVIGINGSHNTRKEQIVWKREQP